MDINDLLNQTKNKSASKKKTKTSVSNKKTEEELKEKMESLQIKHIEEETEKRASSLGVPYISLVGQPIPADALAVVEEDKAREYKILSFAYKQGEYWHIGVVDYPLKDEVKAYIDKIAKKKGLKPSIYLITEDSLKSALKLYSSVPKFLEIQTGVTITEDDLKKYQEELSDFRELNKKIKEVNLTDVVTLVIAAALKFGASDIHIEAEEKDIKIRFRIDGILNDVATLPEEAWKKLISRIKLISELKLNVDDVPQDGRFTIHMADDKVDVRVSTLPTAYGESVVMRLLKSTATSLAFEDLGLRGLAEKRLQEQIKKTNGMIITTGPTGSGKTTTLYAILNKLNDEATKIITLENPIEYHLAGVNQSEVNKGGSYNFATG